MSKVSASPSARRGASWPAGCSSASPPAADGAEPRQRAGGSGQVPVPSGWRSTQRTDQRARHHQQADLLERRREAQAERLADRLEGHVGGDAVDHDRRHDGEEDGQAQALDQEHDRDHGDRQEKGSEEHDGRDISPGIPSSLSEVRISSSERAVVMRSFAAVRMTWAVVPHALLCSAVVSASPRRRAPRPLVRTEGKNFIAPDGSTLLIKGISLGNWLMPEGYMFKFEVAKAPRQIYGAFDRLLGPERAQAFWTAVPRHLHRRRTTSASSSRSASTRCASRCTTRCS